ncbi:testis-specific gene 13 protein [Rhinatrema bivittatum]|uniref:testis-specific gene 13 protein n=1 Tax=Rhinatrema bivittatum TaxID=194408 RepID=UPI001128C6A2|nr:testis-specific gene 13 protein [Rhinatrema bivittatum]
MKSTAEARDAPHGPPNQRPRTPFCLPPSPSSAPLSHAKGLKPIQEPLEELVPVTEQGEGDEELPRYVRELYKFLGQGLAEYFLHPTWQESSRPSSRRELFLQATENPRSEDLWRLLREKSQAKLPHQVTKLSAEHQESGFLRRPRSRFEERLGLYRKTIGLLYRAAEINQDKASLMMTNNPLPDVNSWQWKDTPMTYLCKDAFERKPTDAKHLQLPPLKFHKNQLMGTAKKVSTLTSGTVKAGKRSYRFVSEDTFRSAGQFSKRCAERRELNQRPKDFFYMTKAAPVPTKTESAHTKQVRSAKPVEGKAPWEPLTYSATLESRPSVTAPGEGDFRHGKAPQWLINTSVPDKVLQPKTNGVLQRRE